MLQGDGQLDFMTYRCTSIPVPVIPSPAQETAHLQQARHPVPREINSEADAQMDIYPH